MSNHYSLQKRKTSLEKEIIALQNYLSQAPEGTLVCRQKSSGNYDFSYYTRDETGRKKETHIPRSNKILAEKLACRDYARKHLSDCKKELQVLTGFLNFYCSEKSADHFLKTHPGVSELIFPMLNTPETYAKQWLENPYVRNNKYPEDLIYPTVDPNLKVRSKSESDIISRLINYKVPYRYEEQNIINGIPVCPDFTCLNVRTREEFYWEHQGAWDKQDYVLKLAGREDLYRIAGIIPWKNLIITTETANQPLDINWVDTIIQYYLL